MNTLQYTTFGKVINASSSGANEIVAAMTGKKIVVFSYTIISAGTVTVTWKRASTELSGAMPLIANSGISASCDKGILETAEGEALNLTLSGAVGVTGHLTYTLQ